MAVGHYLDNLRQQVFAAQITAIWGAKNPHLQGHLPGGVTVAQQLGSVEWIAQYKYMIKEQIKFIEEVYIPDLLAVAGFYKDWAAIGGNKNFLVLWRFPRRRRGARQLLLQERNDSRREARAGEGRPAEDYRRCDPRLV